MWKVKTDFSRLFRSSELLSLSILAIMILIILPALASEAFATDPASGPQTGRATAVASARVVKPFTMTSVMQDTPDSANAAIMVSHSTSFRNCEILLGADAGRSPGESCELRLVELH